MKWRVIGQTQGSLTGRHTIRIGTRCQLLAYSTLASQLSWRYTDPPRTGQLHIVDRPSNHLQLPPQYEQLHNCQDPSTYDNLFSELFPKRQVYILVLGQSIMEAVMAYVRFRSPIPSECHLLVLGLGLVVRLTKMASRRNG